MIAKLNQLTAAYPYNERIAVTGTLCHFTAKEPKLSAFEQLLKLWPHVEEQNAISHFFFSVDELSISSTSDNVYAISKITKGTTVQSHMLRTHSGVRRGFASKYLGVVDEAVGRTTLRDIQPGEGLTEADLSVRAPGKHN
jgi:flagella basal body P-ring formation protein FlgA